MLCGTYQAFCPGLRVPMENLSYEDQRNLFSLGYRDDFVPDGAHELGFSPVWLFPMETMRDAFVHSLMAVASRPHMFLVYDIPDEFITKVDWVQHHRYPYANPVEYTVFGSDNRRVEILVPEEYFKIHAPILWCFVSNFSIHFFDNLHLHRKMMHFPEKLQEEFYSKNRVLFSWFNYASLDLDRIAHTVEDFDYQTRRAMLPFAVACVPYLQLLATSLPYIHKSDGSELPKISEASVIRGTTKELVDTYSDFIHDAAHDKLPPRKYEYYYDCFSSMVRDPLPKSAEESLFEDIPDIC